MGRSIYIICVQKHSTTCRSQNVQHFCFSLEHFLLFFFNFQVDSSFPKCILIRIYYVHYLIFLSITFEAVAVFLSNCFNAVNTQFGHISFLCVCINTLYENAAFVNPMHWSKCDILSMREMGFSRLKNAHKLILTVQICNVCILLIQDFRIIRIELNFTQGCLHFIRYAYRSLF